MVEIEQTLIEWSEYLRYRAVARGFELAKIENIMRFSGERYLDTVTGRLIVAGKHDDRLVIIPYEKKGAVIIPITIHATTRQQINFRLKTGRFTIA